MNRRNFLKALPALCAGAVAAALLPKIEIPEEGTHELEPCDWQFWEFQGRVFGKNRWGEIIMMSQGRDWQYIRAIRHA
jgi:hypothetical protein